MIGKNTLNELRKISPTLSEYEKAKKIVDKYEKIFNADDISNFKKFYVDRGTNCYSVGIFDCFVGDGSIQLKIEDNHWLKSDLDSVYETKQKDMIHLQSGIE